MEYFNNLITYFCEYELYDKMFSNKIKDKKAKDIILEDCNVSFISANMATHKIEKIYNALYSNLVNFQVKDVKRLIGEYVHGYTTLDDLFQSLPFKNRKYLHEPKQFTDEVLHDNSFQLYYPVYLRKKKNAQQPLLTFSCELLDDFFQISKVYVNKEILTVLIAQQKEIEITDARSLYEDSVDAFTSAVEALSPAESFLDLYKVICGEYENIFTAGLTDFSRTNEWQVLQKAMISFESPDNSIENCFRDEMSTLARYYGQDHILPETVQRYLGLSPKKAVDIGSVDFCGFHLGSYQADYSVNKKQWELLQLSKNSTLLCVEGPPGTGKTTLLKELVADTLVQKANSLLEVWDKEWENLGPENKEVARSPLLGQNLNSVVISSTNNKAINNIGLELIREIPFFHDFAKTIQCDNLEVSGILCARLGNTENIKNFYSSFYAPFCKYLNTTDILEEDIASAKKDYIKFHTKLLDINRTISELLSKRTFFKSFRNIESLEDMESRLVHQSQMVTTQIEQCEQQISLCKQLLSELKDRSRNLQQSLAQKQSALGCSELELTQLYTDLKNYENIGPLKQFFSFLFPTTKALLRKYGSAEQIRDMIFDCKESISKFRSEIASIQQDIVSVEADQKSSSTELSTHNSHHSQLHSDLQNILYQEDELKTYRQYLCTLATDLNISTSELMCNTIDAIRNYPVIRELRHRLFVSSLRIFEVYILQHKIPILKNLGIFLTEQDSLDGRGTFYRWCSVLYNGDAPYSESKAALVRTLWETFFLCFPVITTTLHSFKKNIFQFIPNLFDTLMLDESGQIIPYYVLAPLYRARKAIFVGDINQIEPIKNVPVNMLEKKYTNLLGENLYSQFCIDLASAQSFATAASDYCETIGDQPGSIMLNEHRRCETAIMAFSNEHIYRGALELTRADNPDKLFGSNLVAFDIRGYKANQHFNQAEIDACREIVDMLVKKYGENIKEQIGIITPFNFQAKKLKAAIPDVEVGTVHIFQGDEKSYILFSSVIDNTEKGVGLGRFVGGKGNLLNVAFSRAKNQFIYIGNLLAARNANNYLKRAVNSISAHGSVFSLFDIDESADNHFLSDISVLNILAGKQYASTLDRIGQHLKIKLPHRIIDSPKLHNEILNDMLAMSTQSLHVVSPWIGSNVVTNDMLTVIREKIKEEIQIHITFGYKAVRCSLENIDELVAQDIPWRKEDAAALIHTLKDLLGKTLRFSPPSHVKLLLVDDKYLFIGSLNWLYNSGKTNQKEISCLITNPDTIKYVKEQFLS